MTYKTQWEIVGGGEIHAELTPDEIAEMTDAEIESHFVEGAQLMILDQGDYQIRLPGVAETIRRMREES